MPIGPQPGTPTGAFPRSPVTWPWWLQVIAVYGLTRLWSVGVLVLGAAGQPESYWGPANPGYGTFVALFWDADWYRRIAEEGYPTALPRDVAGSVQQNAWAFYPLLPLLVRGLTDLTGGSWVVLAPLTALLLGFGAALVLDRLIQSQAQRRLAPAAARRLALGTVLLVGFHPAAPVLQAAYTESLALLLVALTLFLLVRRSYLPAVPVVLALGFARPVALPMLAVVLVHLAVRVREHRRGRDPLQARETRALVALAAAGGLAGVAWPAASGWVTGTADAYVQTQSAWRGSFSSAPVVPWLEMAEYLMGPAGLVVLLLLVAAALALALAPAASFAGVEVQAWGVAYLVYLLLVAFPQTSLIRFLLLAFPLATAAVVLVRTRAGLLALAGLGAVGQVVWVLWLWQLTTPTAWPP